MWDRSLRRVTIFDRDGEVVEAPAFTVTLPVGDTTRYLFVAPFADAPAFLDFTPACGGVYLAATGGRSIRWEFFDPAGERIATYEDQTLLGPPVERREWDRYLASLGTNREAFERVVRPPERHSPAQDLRLTSNGYVLTRATPTSRRAELAHWRIWPLVRSATEAGASGAADAAAGPGSTGTLTVGAPIDIQLPWRFTPYEVRADTIWGIESDELNVETLRAYRVPVALPEPCGAHMRGGRDSTSDQSHSVASNMNERMCDVDRSPVMRCSSMNSVSP